MKNVNDAQNEKKNMNDPLQYIPIGFQHSEATVKGKGGKNRKVI